MFTISYFSCYNEPYGETKLRYTEGEARKVFQDYVKDVCEQVGMEYDEDEYKNRFYFEHASDNGTLFLVKIERQEQIAENEDDYHTIQAFLTMLNNRTPGRIDVADEEHMTESILNLLDYIDRENGKE